MLEQIKKAAEYIRKTQGEAEIGLILGSGLADVLPLENARVCAYADIPGFPESTVQGHKSEWVTGNLGGKRVYMMRGRFHYYEGFSLDQIVFPIRVMKLLGVKTIILTNAAGGVNESFQPGDLMLLDDFINYSGVNPLMGKNEEAFGVRFPDMTNALDDNLRILAKECAKKQGLSLQEGVYMWFSGPSYETPAEIRMARTLGADAVGMSTVPEIIAARHCGIKVLGISSITNMAAGVSKNPICHSEVIETGKKVEAQMRDLLTAIIEKI